MDKKANESIGCTVQQCEFNNGEGYCSLERIQVGTHENDPTVVQCTDCESFVRGEKHGSSSSSGCGSCH